MISDTDFASYADHSTSYMSVDTINEGLETASVELFKWFMCN